MKRTAALALAAILAAPATASPQLDADKNLAAGDRAWALRAEGVVA